MFGGGAPPPSEEEIRAQEDLANQTLYGAGVICAMLYFSPFVIDYSSKFWPF